MNTGPGSHDHPDGKTAVVYLTQPGAALAQRLAETWTKAGRPVEVISPDCALSELVRSIWHDYGNFVFIMAAGIVVRLVAPLLRSKWADPGIVVVDEGGHFAVSLLGGHWGMANSLTREVASCLSAVPVVTTATDVRGKPALDQLARQCGFLPLPRERIKGVHMALLAGECVAVYTEWDLAAFLDGQEIKVRPWCEPSGIPDCVPIFVTSRRVDPLPQKGLCLCPPSLMAGIGCRRGVSGAEVTDALQRALEQVGRRLESVRLLAGHIIKENEEGLRDAAHSLGLEIVFFDTGVLQDVLRCNSGLDDSEFVRSQVGVGGVCETAALAAVGEGRLVLPKTKYGRVTVALAEADWLLSASGRVIRRI